MAKHKPSIHLGVNILPDGKGTESALAYDLANEFGLSFVVFDAIAGAYTLERSSSPISFNEAVFESGRSKNRDIVVIGGIYSSRATPADSRPEKNKLVVASHRADALIVRENPRDGFVPVEKFHEYRSQVSTPLFLAASANAPSPHQPLDDRVISFCD